MSTPPPIPPDQPNLPPVPPQPPGSGLPSSSSGHPLWEPQGSYPPVVSPKSTMSGATKALLFGCLGIVLIVLIGVGFGVRFIWNVAKNPAQFLAEAVVKSNPQLEIKEVDTVGRTMTFRDKASGETMTARLDDLKGGRIMVTKSDGSEMELSAEGMKTTDKDGNQTVAGAGGSVPLPEWVPAYPEPRTVIMSSRQKKKDSLQGACLFSTPDDVAAVKTHYQKALAEAGYIRPETAEAEEAGVQSTTIKASADLPDGERRTVTVRISSSSGQTQVNLNYDQSPAEK